MCVGGPAVWEPPGFTQAEGPRFAWNGICQSPPMMLVGAAILIPIVASLLEVLGRHA